MTQENEGNINLSSQQLGEYRAHLARALHEVEQYAGTEGSNEALLNVLGNFELWIVNALGLPENQGVSDELQTALWQRANSTDTQVQTIDSMIDQAIQRLTELLAEDLEPWRIAERLGVLYEHRGRTLAPAGDGQIETGSGEGFRGPRFERRAQHLITELQRSEIFLDDLIIRDGITVPGAMRERSYMLIEIPRLRWSEVFLCNQVGEGTRINLRPQGVETYENHRKRELDQVPGMSREWCHDMRSWSHSIIERVTARNERGLKVNVPLLESLRIHVKRNYTAHQWLNLDPREIADIALLGARFPEVVEQICGETFATTEEDRLKWAGRIFGYGNEDVSAAQQREWNRTHRPTEQIDEWRASIIREFPTANELNNALATLKGRNSVFHLAYELGLNVHSVGFGFNLGSEEFVSWIYGDNEPPLEKEMNVIGPPEMERLVFVMPLLGREDVETIRQKIDTIEALQADGLYSLRAIRTLRRHIDYAEHCFDLAERYAEMYCSENQIRRPEDASSYASESRDADILFLPDSVQGGMDGKLKRGEIEKAFAILQICERLFQSSRAAWQKWSSVSFNNTFRKYSDNHLMKLSQCSHPCTRYGS